MKQLFLCVALAVVMPAAMAGSDIDTSQSVQSIVEQQRIRKEVTTQRNGWDEVPAMKRSAVLRDQDEVFMLLEGKQTIADMNPDQQVKVANRSSRSMRRSPPPKISARSVPASARSVRTSPSACAARPARYGPSARRRARVSSVAAICGKWPGSTGGVR
jgi:hypothetical protein